MADARARKPAALALAPAVVLFTILVAHSLLETARDALFLARLGAERLAIAYLAIAAFAMLAIFIVRRGLRMRDPRRVLVAFLVLATVGTAALSTMIATSSTIVFVLYVWTGFVATLVVPSFWTAIDRSLELREAKRVFGAIGAGGVLGAMAGSALASVLGRLVPATQLVTAGAVAFMVATIAAVALVPRKHVPEPPARYARLATRSVQARHYVRLLLGLGVVSTIVLTLGDFTFKRVMAEHLAPEELAVWFGAIYTVLNGIALVIQLVITPKLFARWGVGAALAVLPVILVATAFGFAITGALIAVIALKLGDGGLRHSLHRVASEILYLPVPAAIRDGGKLVADALGQRGGQAIAALVAGGFVLAGAGARTIGMVAAIMGLAWLGIVAITRRAYVAQLRDTLQAGEIQRDVAVPPLDSRSIDLLEKTMASDDEIEALAALDLLARQKRLPARALSDPRLPVVRHALTLLHGEITDDVAQVLRNLLEHGDPHVRAAALAAVARTPDGRQRLVAALADTAAPVRAAAVVGLAADEHHDDQIEAELATLLAGTPADRAALAEAIAFAPTERFRGVLYELLASGEPEVMRGALHVLARAPELAEVERLIALVADGRLRTDVRRALIAAGDRALDALIAAVADPATPAAVRRHLPRTIMRFHSRRAAAALVTRLPHEPDDGTQLKLLRALGRMRSDDPRLRVDPLPLRQYVRRAVRDAARYATLADELARRDHMSSASALIREILVDKRRAALERAFRVLGILHPRAGVRSAWDALVEGDDSRFVAARELVEALAPIEVRAHLLAVIDELSPAERRERLGALVGPPFRTYEAFVAALLADPSQSLRCAVARHVAERHLVALRGELQRLRPLDGPALVTYAFDEAIARLDA